MWLIAGLGNPGKRYEGTRHNTGFEVINKLAYDNNINLNKWKFRAYFGEGMISGEKVLLIKPQTFMNLSGECVRDFVEFYKMNSRKDKPGGNADVNKLEKIIIIYDDSSLKPSEIRIRLKGTPGGHNGIKNIIYQLETDEFPRIKVGIGEKPPGWDLADYVLSTFRKEEFDDIVSGITNASAAVEMILKEGFVKAMNMYNKKTGAGKTDD